MPCLTSRFFSTRNILSTPCVKAGLAHYQFETIHPFLDGNGRIGRLLITLSLMNDGVLELPVLYPSYELKRRRSEYYGRLTSVRETGDYEGWIAFFCDCLLESALDARDSMRALAELHASTERLVLSSMGRGSANALRLLELLEGSPIVGHVRTLQSAWGSAPRGQTPSYGQ